MIPEKEDSMPGLKGTIKKAGRAGKKAVKTGTSPVTYIPKTAAKGYSKTTKTLRRK